MNKRISKLLATSLMSVFILSGCAGGGGSASSSSAAGGGSSSSSSDSSTSGGSSTSTSTSSGVTSSGGTIKIGVFEPLTGANASGGELDVKGIKLANKLYPEALGKKIELVIVDNKSDKVEAANAASKLIDKDKVQAIIGSWGSSLCMAAGDAIKNAQIPAVAASATNPLVTQGNPYYSRVAFLDSYQAKVMASYAFNTVKAKKIAIIQEVSNDYSVGLAKFFQDEFKKITGDNSSIVEVSSYNTGDRDFSAQLTSIKAKNPDAIFAPGNFTESALICKQAKELGMDVPMLGGDTWEIDKFLEVGGSGVEGATFSTFFDADTPINDESKKFLDAWKAEYPNEEPAATAVLAYDAYILIIDAINRANSDDPVKINEAIRATKDFEGAAGSVTIDENGNAVKAAIIKTVKDGKFKFVEAIDAN